MQQPSIRMLIQLLKRDLDGLKKRQKEKTRKFEAIIDIICIYTVPTARNTQNSIFLTNLNGIWNGIKLSSPRIQLNFLGTSAWFFLYFMERQMTHTTSNMHATKQVKLVNRFPQLQEQGTVRSLNCHNPKNTNVMKQNHKHSFTTPKRILFTQTSLQNRRSFLNGLSVLFLRMTIPTVQSIQKAIKMKQCPAEMKNVVSLTAFTQLTGVAEEAKSEGIRGEKILGRNQKLRQPKLQRKPQQLQGRVDVTNIWKYMCWNTSLTKSKAYEPLNSKIASTTRATQLRTLEKLLTDLVLDAAAGDMQSQDGSGEVIEVVVSCAPIESFTEPGLRKVRLSESQLRDTVVWILIRQEELLTWEAVHEYDPEGSPAILMLIMLLILVVSIQTGRLKVSFPQSCPF